MKAGLWGQHAVCVPAPVLSTFEFLNQSLWNLVCVSWNLRPPQRRPSHQCLCLYVYSSIVARQRLGKNITAPTNSHATIELLDASFSVRFVPYQRKVGVQFFPELLVFVLCVDVHLDNNSCDQAIPSSFWSGTASDETLGNAGKRIPPSTGGTPRLTPRTLTHWRWLNFLILVAPLNMMTLISSCLGLMHLRTPLQVRMASLPLPKMTRYLVLGPYLMRICFTPWQHVRNTHNPVADGQIVNLP
jgi:hypothetical protein